MSATDRLDDIRERYVEWHSDRGDHTAAPDTDLWPDADHPDETMEHCIVRNDVPAMFSALQAVLYRHPAGRASVVAGVGRQEVEHCMGCRGAHGIAHDEHGLVPWPCPTVRAVETALGGAS